jgi:hypothetical protein
MSALCLFTSETFQTGDLVCVSSNGSAVAYDAKDPLPVVGVAIKPISGYNPNGRQWFAINGAPYYTNDQYIWQDDLTSDFTAENPSYIPYNPLVDTAYITAVTHGIAAVTKTAIGIPTGWIKLQEKTDFDWYLIK